MLLPILSPTSYAGAPEVSTQNASSIASDSAILVGIIENTHTAVCTERGFWWGSTTTLTENWSEGGSFSAGSFTHIIYNLNAGQTYYYQSYATNSFGTTYGEVKSFVAGEVVYDVLIDGVSRRTDILVQSLTVDDVVNDEQNTCTFTIVDNSGLGLPEVAQEIILTLEDGTKLFGGYITTVDMSKAGNGAVQAQVTCVDYSWLLDRNLVHETYLDMSDANIIKAIVDEYAATYGITYANVVAASTITQVSFNYIQPSQAFRRIAEATNRNWYIDYDKDLHYFANTDNPAPFNIDSASNGYWGLRIAKDARQLKNRIYVRGGTKLSDATTYSVKGDGVAKKFPLPDKPHDVALTVNGVSKTVGIKNVNTSGYDWYLNFQEKYVEQDAGASALATTDTLAIAYSYDIPILIAQEEPTSIIANGVKEFAIFDTSIKTTQAARDRATAELTDYASTIIEGSFNTMTPGFRSGQYVNINLTEYGVNADYVVQRVNAVSIGGGLFEYTVSIASAKTMGIIKFLIELLEADKNLIALDDDEVVDELFNVTDVLLGDSLTDSLTIDSCAGNFTWCKDSGQAAITTRAVWDLFQWT